MNIIKSILVLLALLALVLFAIYRTIICIQKHRDGDLNKRAIISLGCHICVTVIILSLFGNYVYPFERTLDPVLIAEFDVPEKYALDYPGQVFWHGAYKEYGLYAESFHFDPDNLESKYGFGWPPMDFDRHNYIITYGQKIEKLSYNVWDTIDAPIRTGAKAGHMVLDENFYPEKVFVYEIPKVRIENDINELDCPMMP